MGSNEPVWSHFRPHNPPQQTTAKASVITVDPRLPKTDHARHETLLRGPAQKDRRCPRARHAQNRSRPRRAQARTHEALIEAMGKALDAVSARDARGFFGHSGYRATGQPF